MIGKSINKLILGSGSYDVVLDNSDPYRGTIHPDAGVKEIELIDTAIRELFRITDSLGKTRLVRKMPKKEIKEAISWLKKARRKLYLGKKSPEKSFKTRGRSKIDSNSLVLF